MKLSKSVIGLAAVYLLVGLFQGGAFYILFDLGESLPVTVGTTLYFVALLVPLVFYCTIDIALRQRLMALGVTLLFAVIVGLYHSWTMVSTEWDHFPWAALSLPLLVTTVLVASCLTKEGYLNTVERLFLICERLLSALVLFGVFWIFINLCDTLFRLIDIRAIDTIFLGKKAIIWSGLIFSFAIFLASQSNSKVFSTTSFLTRFFGWLFPFAALIAVIFVLVMTARLQMLLDTRKAAAILLWYLAFLAFFFNLKTRAGTEVIAAKWLKMVSLLGWLAALPMVGVAIYALGLRVAQYGLTPDRFYSLWVALLAVVLVVGYAAAQVLRRDCLISATNITASGLIVLGTALTTVGIVDPGRLSVHDQMRRLGQVNELNEQIVDTLDFLAQQRTVFGQRALKELVARGEQASATETSKTIASMATQALTLQATQALILHWRKSDYIKQTTSREITALKVYPQGETLPDGLGEALQNNRYKVRGNLKDALVWKTQFSSDGTESWVVFSSTRDQHDRGRDYASVWQPIEGKWREVGVLQTICSDDKLSESVLTLLKEGRLRMVPRLPLMDVELPGGNRLHFVPKMCESVWETER